MRGLLVLLRRLEEEEEGVERGVAVGVLIAKRSRVYRMWYGVMTRYVDPEVQRGPSNHTCTAL